MQYLVVGNPQFAMTDNLAQQPGNRRRVGRFGFQTMCEGGGQANATVIERRG